MERTGGRIQREAQSGTARKQEANTGRDQRCVNARYRKNKGRCEVVGIDFKMIKMYYGMGLYTDDDIKVFVAAGYITEKQSREITGAGE